MSGTQLLAVGFLGMILLGTILLMLPISSKQGIWTDPLTALFTATSASCVTGLIVVNTFEYWSTFGHVVLIVMIQIGGLGFITLGSGILLLQQRHFGLRERNWLKDSLNVLEYKGLTGLLALVLKGTLLFEGVGALILAIRFIPKMGFADGIIYGIFHSISAFCNAGFDLFGKYGMSSVCSFKDDPVVILTFCVLILGGGLGFLTWEDLKNYKFNYKKYSLATKIILSMSAVLVIGGTILFLLIENSTSFAGMNGIEKFLSALFCAVTPRTAGFNIVDYGIMSEGGKLLTILLMFIGGASGSTAGGAKMATVFVLMLYLMSTLRRSTGTNIFGRRIGDDIVKRAAAVISIYVTLIIIASVTICSIQPFSIGDTLFEVVSAVCTVGVTTGITSQLNSVSRLIIIVLMYLGRLGTLSFAMSFTENKRVAHITLPLEEVTVG